MRGVWIITFSQRDHHIRTRWFRQNHDLGRGLSGVADHLVSHFTEADGPRSRHARLSECPSRNGISLLPIFAPDAEQCSENGVRSELGPQPPLGFLECRTYLFIGQRIRRIDGTRQSVTRQRQLEQIETQRRPGRGVATAVPFDEHFREVRFRADLGNPLLPQLSVEHPRGKGDGDCLFRRHVRGACQVLEGHLRALMNRRIRRIVQVWRILIRRHRRIFHHVLRRDVVVLHVALRWIQHLHEIVKFMQPLPFAFARRPRHRL